MEDSDPPDEINRATVGCENLIRSCLSIEKLCENEWAQSRLDDFRLWSAGLNATAAGHAGLEWRLRSRPDVKEVVLGFLEDLTEKIQDCLDHGWSSGTLLLEIRVLKVLSCNNQII